MKKILALLLAVCLMASLCACGSKTEEPTRALEPAEETVEAPAETAEASEETAAAPADGEVTILYTNDIHCAVDENLGFKGVALIRRTLEAQGKNVLLVDSGDATQGGTIGTLSKGEYVIDIMNELGYDVAAIGNHDFDYGMEQFHSNLERAEFPFVSCNFLDADGSTILPPYVILESDGMKLAFVGISTPETFVSSVPASFQNENGEWIYSFCGGENGEELYTQVQSAVDAARAEGADYVIALAHLGTIAASAPWMSGDVITHTTGIDVMLDAHSHSTHECEWVKNAEGHEVLMTSTGTKLATVGCLTLKDGKFTTTLLDTSETAEYIDGILSQFDELTNEVVAHTDVDLCITDPATGMRMIRSNETNLGDLCADAYRAMSGADIAIVNGGGIRSDIPAGDITYGQIISVHPFGNALCMIEITGAELLDALELSVSGLPSEFGGFLQVSGMTFTVDLSVESTVETDSNGMFVGVNGERRVKDVMIGDEPLDPEKTYTLASHDYKLKFSGDGYNMFADNTLLIDGMMLDNQVLINYIIDVLGGSVGEEYADVYGEGRINIING